MTSVFRSSLFIGALPFLLLGPPALAHQPRAHECGTETAGKIGYKYCIDRPSANASGDIMFYFHGLAESEAEFSRRYKKHILGELARRGAAPTVVSISFGRLWFLTDTDSSSHPALHELVVTTIIPQMESKVGARLRHRLLMGESMGGFNAIQALVKDPRLFYAAVLLCPAISTLAPTSTDAEIDQYASSHLGVDKNHLYLARRLAQAEFPTSADWVSHDPLELVNFLGPASPPFYISGGTRDQWGFYEGQVSFTTLARSRGANVTWTSIPNRTHCVQTTDSWNSLLTFLTKVEMTK